MVVGNWVVGGAGKTPTTVALVLHLLRQGRRPGVISRGYGRRLAHGPEAPCVVQADSTAEAVGDEPLLIHRRTGVPTVVARERARARDVLLLAHPEVDVVICDDGLQHHRLHRDLAVVVFDERGIGNGWCLPAGPLRAPWPTTPPSGALVLYNADRATTAWPGHTAQRRLQGIWAWDDWRTGRHQNGSAVDGLPLLRTVPQVHAAAGIGSPERFFAQLAQAGLQACPHPLPDHHDWKTQPWPAEARHGVITEKDAVKLLAASRPATPGPALWVATLDFQPEPGFWEALDERLARLDRPTRPTPPWTTA